MAKLKGGTRVYGSFKLDGGLYDANNQVGSASSILVSTGAGVSWTTSFAAGLQGSQGTQGLQGRQGTQGLQGIQGIQGVQGTQGLSNQGSQGVQGLSNQGSQGVQGLSNQGVQGLQGLQGTQGSQGVQNAQGSQGVQGLSNQGSQGVQGLSNQGSQGVQGLSNQGSQGVQNAQGTQGLQGTQGITGANAGFAYTFSTTTTAADPGSGFFRFNSAVTGSITEMYISDLDITGTDRSSALITFDDTPGTDRARIYLPGPSTGYTVSITVTGAITDNTTWLTIPVSFTSGALPANNDIRNVIGVRNGIQGSQGVQNTQGTQGSQGVQNAQGSQGVQGLSNQGSQGVQGLSNQGSQGVQGRQGTQGLQGIQGVQGPPPGQVFFVGSAEGANTTTISLTGITQLQDGDFILVTTYADDATVATPSGYTSIAGGTGGTATSTRYRLSYKFRSADTSVTITAPASGQYVTLVSVFRNVDTTSPLVSATGGTPSEGTTGDANPPAITTTSRDTMIVPVVFKDDATGTATPPSGYTLISSPSATQGTVAAAYLLLSAPATVDPGTFTGLVSDQWVSFTLGLDSVGSPGAQGLQGTQGTQGTQGSQGVQNAQGTQGVQGLGSQGSQGVQGLSNQGVQGPAGSGVASTSITAYDTTAVTTLYPVMVSATGSATTAFVRSTATALSFNASTNILSASEVDITASGSANNSVLSLTGTVSGASGANGLLGIGALSFSDTDIIASFTHSVNSYAQLVVQNKNSGASSSADIIVNNDRAAGTTFYGDFGINGTTFAGGGVFGDVDGTYLYSAGGTLTLGSLNANVVKIATNSTERIRVLSTGQVGIGSTIPTSNLTINATAVPTNDVVYISNNGFPATTAGVNNLQIDYVGGAAAVEAGAVRVGMTPGATSGGTWNSFRILPTAAASGVVQNAIKCDSITAGVGTDNALWVGTGWDSIINYNNTSIINGVGEFVGRVNTTSGISTIGFLSATNINASGIVTANAFYGSGANLTGLVPNTVSTSSATTIQYIGFLTTNSGTTTSISASTGLVFIPSSTNVGIATTNPRYDLEVGPQNVSVATTSVHINGALRIAGAIYDSNNNVGTAGSVLSSNGSGTGVSWIAAGSGGGGSIAANAPGGTAYYPLFTNQTAAGSLTNINISTSKLTYNDSTGTLSATVFTSLSDETQKTNITRIANALDLVMQMNGVRYDWADGHNTGSVGVIAQEMEKILPEVVTTNDRGLKTVSYGNLVGVLIEAIKEQQVRIEELERKLDA